MARELSRTLTQEDVVFLGQRYPAATVDRYVELYGAPEGDAEADEPDTEDETPDEGDESGQESSEEGTGDPEPTPEADEAESGSEDDEEDLIGETLGNVATELYDPLAHTTKEVRDHMKTASVDEVNRVKVIERERSDREPRTSITEFNPS